MKALFSLRFLRHCLVLGIFAAFSVVILVTSAYLYLQPEIPSIDGLKDIRLQTPLRVYSAEDELIGEFGEIRRIPISIDQIPQTYIDALLSTEDKEFYNHNGVSIKGLGRAAVHLALTGKKKYGGSTITMQVARNYFLHKRKKFKRKFIEIILALRIEKAYSKEEILEMYANVIFLGNRANGVQSASQVYYGKNLDELNLAQIAMIAGLPHAPSSKNPLSNPAKALQRRNLVLKRMYEDGKIDEPTYLKTIDAPITAKYHGRKLETAAPHIAEMARQEAIKRYGDRALTDGLKIYTTVKADLQRSAQASVLKGLLDYDLRHGYRGAESNLLDDDKAVLSAEQKSWVRVDVLDEWETVLADIPAYQGLQAAAVISLHDGEQKQDRWVTAILGDGREIQLRWDGGLGKARSYISAELKGRAPRNVSDVLKLGDVIRVHRKDGAWHLTQVPEVQAALVSLDSKDGAILSLVGGFNFYQNKFNRAIQARRQPGSNFKPFVYVNALEKGFTAATVVNDAPYVQSDRNLEGTWRPKNSSLKFYGPTRLRKALSSSINLVSVRVLKAMGVSDTIRSLERFGFDPAEFPRNLSLALGSHALSPMEVVTGYATFANGGYKIEPYFIRAITDASGEVLFRTMPRTVCEECEFSVISDESHENLDILPTAERVVDQRTSYIINSMLKDVVNHGTGTRAKVLKRKDLAGKTGTTNDNTNAWFSGYSSGVVTTTWVGFDDRSKLGSSEFGGSAALPIWVSYMKDALEGRTEYQPPLPKNIVTVRIDPDTGNRARIDDKNAIFEVFKTENVPLLEAQAYSSQKGHSDQLLDPYF